MHAIDGIHHISLITGDAPRNVDFYARVLGLRMVKRTVNQDEPGVYHLFYADEHGSPGADITFFEYPGARPGRAGAGMVSSIVHRVASAAALDFWAERLGGEGVAVEREPEPPALRRPGGHEPRARDRRTAQTSRLSRARARFRPSTRCRASRPSAPWSPTRLASEALLSEALGFI